MAIAGRLGSAEYEALADFRYELRRFLRFSEEAAKSEGLRPLQYQLLLQIKGLRPPSQPTVGELATRLQMAQHGMVSLITRSEKAGLVARVPGKHDRRVVCVKLTAKGDRALRRVALLHLPELWSVFRLRPARLPAKARADPPGHAADRRASLRRSA
jgi:DNA-binding MarR family transcriptional regulator